MTPIDYSNLPPTTPRTFNDLSPAEQEVYLLAVQRLLDEADGDEPKPQRVQTPA